MPPFSVAVITATRLLRGEDENYENGLMVNLEEAYDSQ